VFLVGLKEVESIVQNEFAQWIFFYISAKTSFLADLSGVLFAVHARKKSIVLNHNIF